VDDAIKIEEEWRRLMDQLPRDRSDNPSFEAALVAAYEHPTLRALWPFPSHGTVSFYRTPWPPYPAPRPERLGFIICDGPPFSVYRGVGFDHLVGAAGTVEDAVVLLAARVSGLAGPDPMS
jgi:hypothetical protein